MAGVNKAILVGNLGRDPEIRYTSDGKAVANFTIATSSTWKDKATGERKQNTEWHRIVAFGRLAEICGEYLSKGKQVFVEGRLQTREWEDQQGNRRWTTEVVASEMQMLGSKADANTFSGQSPASPPDQGGGPPEDDIPF